MRVQNFTDVIGLWPSRQDLADDLCLLDDTIRKWDERDSIKSCWWQMLLRCAKVRGLEISADDLVRLAGRDVG